MRGTNVYNEVRQIRESASIERKKCVFISHKKEDAAFCRQIAEFLMKIGIDVYFDEYDTTINLQNPMSIVTAVERGLAASSYLLVVATPRSLESKWVPWEIGNGYSKRMPLYVLQAKSLPRGTKVPEYMCVAKYLTGWNDLKTMLQTIPNRRLIYESIPEFSYSHPLYNYINP